MDDRITQLEQELESMRARLDAIAHGTPGRTSLRLHSRCPVCDHRSVLRIESVADRGHGGAVDALAPLVDSSIWGQTAFGQFVIYVCRQCGLAEWYVGRLEDIPLDHAGVKVIDGPVAQPPSGPFR